MGSYALMIMPVFSCIEDFVWFKNIKIGEMTSENIVSGSRIAYVLLTLYVSAKCNSLTLILQLSGSFNGLFLQIIMPVAFYVKSYNTQYDELLGKDELDMEEENRLMHSTEEQNMIMGKLVKKHKHSEDTAEATI